MERLALRMLVLLVMSSGVGAFANAVRSKPLPWVLVPKASLNPADNQELARQVQMPPEEFLDHVRKGDAVFVDARNPEDFSEGHIAGAINIPAPKKEEHIGDIMTRLPRDQVIIIYCGGGKCEASNTIFEFLMGFPDFKRENIRIFELGWEFIGKQSDIPIQQGIQ